MVRLLAVLFPALVLANAGSGPRFERITTADGLSQGTVLAILQDQHGFMWFGSQDGLNRYDGYEIRVFRHDPNRDDSLSSNSIYSLLEDPDGYIWVGTSNGGLNRLDTGTGKFKRYLEDPDDPDSLSYRNVTALFRDSTERFWVGTFRGLNLFDPETEVFRSYFHDPENPASLASNSIIRIFEDSRKRLWIGTDKGLCLYDHLRDAFLSYGEGSEAEGGLSGEEVTGIEEAADGRLWVGSFGGGVTLFDPEGGPSEHFRAGNDSGFPTNDFIRHIYRDRKGRLWVGTRNGGVDRIDPQSDTFVNFRFDPGDPRGLSHDEVRFITEDRTGLIWLGTMSGVNKFDPRAEKFAHLRQRSGDPFSLSHNRVKAIFQDSRGTLWVGTFGGGLNRRDQGAGGFRHYRANGAAGLSGDRVSWIYEDRRNTLWMGTESGLNRYDRASDSFQVYLHDPDNPDSISHNRIRGILEDSRDIFWVATLGGGLNRYDRTQDTFTRIQHDPDNPIGLPHDNVYVLFEDNRGKLWVGMQGGGLAAFDATSATFTHYPHVPERKDSLSHSAVWSILEDRHGTLWVGTGGGLNRLNRETGTFTRFREGDGLPNDVIYGVLEDTRGNLWLSTNRGISRFDPQRNDFRNFTPSDGLQGYEFNGGALFRSASGRMYFGGPNGLSAFYPEEVDILDPLTPQLAITDFRLFNQSIAQDAGTKSSPLDQPLQKAGRVTLSHTQNLFSLEFAGIHYGNPKQNKYAYQLAGIDEDWVYTRSDKRFATYTKIPAGDYTFRLRAANRDGVWTETPRELLIEVRPAPWLTWWAYTLYVLVVVLIVFAYLSAQRRKLKKERAINLRLQQVDRLKDEFLANTSHELRTPLHGIIGIAESLIDGAAGPLDDVVRANLTMVAASGKRLANLVNDILDFSKLRTRNLEVRRMPLELHALVDVVLTLSQPLANTKSLTLSNQVPDDLPSVLADEDRVQQILHNLVGNAIKFTEEGEVTVSAGVENGRVQITIADTGIGIPQERLGTIFHSFEQLDASTTRDQGGAGLGLAISRQLVELQEGEISVDSEVGVGSRFHFTLPICDPNQTESMVPAPVKADTERGPTTEVLEEVPHTAQPDQGFEILIADDDQVNRQVLINHLKLQDYRLTEAASGQEVLEVLRTHPGFDLILLDIMMPRMSGYEVCKRVREKYAVQDLPIIFLTAKDRIADIVAGFAVGANDYLTKPVAKDELLSRVRTHLQLLDINRHLEEKVAQRTLELERKTREILRTQNQLLMQEKLASMGTLTAGIAHEIKNPLNFVKNFAELTVDLVDELTEVIEPLKQNLDQEVREDMESLATDIRHNLERVHEHGKRANRIVENMMNMAGNSNSERRTIDVNYLVNEFTNMAYHGVRAKNLKLSPKIHLDMDEAVGRVEVVPQDMGRAIANLVNNALDAMSNRLGEPDYTPELWVRTKDLGEQFSIRIRDNAEGIPEENHEKIFNPFYTTRPVDSGHIGLGLSIAYDIVVQGHHGEMTVDSVVGEYTEIMIVLPKQ